MPSSMEDAICLGSASPQAQATILCTNLACQACKNEIGKEMYGMVGSLNRKKRSRFEGFVALLLISTLHYQYN